MKKEAIKTALAVVIAYAIALALGWEKPLWAAFAVVLISLDTAGQSLNKGTLRMLGTFVGGAFIYCRVRSKLAPWHFSTS